MTIVSFIFLAISVSIISILILKLLKLRRRSKTLLTIAQRERDELKNRIVQYEQEQEKLVTQVTRDAVQFYEEELQFMGAEIHDDLIQRLTEFRLVMYKLDLSEDITELQAVGLQLKNQFPDLVRSVQRISRRLLPDNLVIGSFTNSIRALCMQMERPGSLIIRFESTGSELPIPDDHALHIYRIVQELIHNTIKHSLAWHLDIRIVWTEKLVIEIEDDGTKMVSSAEIINSTTFRTLRMRALKSGAELLFSRANRGMLVTVKYDPENIGGGGNPQMIPLR